MFNKIKNTILYIITLTVLVYGTLINTVGAVDASSEASLFTVDIKFIRDVNTSNPLVLMQEEYINIAYKLAQPDSVVKVGDKFSIVLPKELEVTKNSTGGSHTVDLVVKDNSTSKEISKVLYTIDKNEVTLEVLSLYSYGDGDNRDEITASRFDSFDTDLNLEVRLIEDVDKLEFNLPQVEYSNSNTSSVVIDNTKQSSATEVNLTPQRQARSMMTAFAVGDFNFTLPNVNPFGSIKLESETKTITTGFDGPIVITDNRSTDTGWRLDVSASPLKVTTPASGFVTGTVANVLPLGSVHLSPVESIKNASTGVDIILSDTLSKKSIIDDGAITVTKAIAGKGLGEFNISFGPQALSVVIDPSTIKIDKVNYPVTGTPYESTVRWDLVSAP